MLLENRRAAFFLLLLLFIVAAVFRFWNLGEMPPGLYHDEAYNGLDALSLLQSKTFPQFYEGWELYAQDAHAQRPAQETRFPIFFEGNYGREPAHIYLMALSIAMLDATPLAVRAVPAAAGVLAVLATFFAARALYPDRGYLIPLTAAATITVLYPALHFSRFGIRAMLFVPIETMAVAFFMKGISAGNKAGSDKKIWVWFLGAGILLGLSIYTFAAARLFPLVWVLFVPVWFFIDKSAFRRYWPKIGLMALAAFLTAAPLLWFFARYPYYFLFRIAYVANKGAGTVEDKPWLTWLFNAGRVLRGFLYLGETHLRHNLPGRPYFDLIQVGLFLIGFGRSLLRIMNPRYLFLFIWFGIMLLPSILSGDAPHFGRLIGAAAPAAILIALGFEWLYLKLRSWLQGRFSAEAAKMMAGVVLVVLWLASAVWTGWDYFLRYGQHPDLAEDFYQDDWQMGIYAAGKGGDGDVYLSPGQEELATILFALQDVDQLRNYDASDKLVPTGSVENEILYLFKEADENIINRVQSIFDEITLDEPGGKFTSLYIPAGTDRTFNLKEIDYHFDDRLKLLGWSMKNDGQNIVVTLAWQSEVSLQADYTAFVHLIDNKGEIISQVDRQPLGYPTSDWRPGEMVIDQFSLQLPDQGYSDQDYRIRTGFYYLPTSKRIGDPLILSE